MGGDTRDSVGPSFELPLHDGAVFIKGTVPISKILRLLIFPKKPLAMKERSYFLIFFSGTARTTKRERHHHAKENKHKKRAKMEPQAFSLSLLPSAAAASGTDHHYHYVVFLNCSLPSLWLYLVE